MDVDVRLWQARTVLSFFFSSSQIRVVIQHPLEAGGVAQSYHCIGTCYEMAVWFLIRVCKWHGEWGAVPQLREVKINRNRVSSHTNGLLNSA